MKNNNLRKIYTIILTFLLGVAWGFGFNKIINDNINQMRCIYGLYTIYK